MRLYLLRLPISPSVCRSHAVAYLLALPLSSIALLVFLNSTLSFLLTNVFHTPASSLGSISGTLGFTDELVAIFAAPLWGVISDGRIGTRGVSVLAYIAIAAALVLSVSLKSVYPGLLLARVLFSVGAAAATTMVTAILPEMTLKEPTALIGEITTTGTLNVELAPTGKLAGLIGLLSGLGALLSLALLLPLPSHISKWYPSLGPDQSIRIVYILVATLACVSRSCAGLGFRRHYLRAAILPQLGKD
jgi:MFS family permease